MLLDINSEIIEKKAYLGHDELINIELPENIRQIHDWAFSQCGRLKTIKLNNKIEYMGRNIFSDCKVLQNIYVQGILDENDDNSFLISEMLCGALKYFKNEAIYWIRNAVTPEWILRWDDECAKYISMQDDIGFIPFLAGGEEDYDDNENEKLKYLHDVIIRKIRMILHRLILAPDYPIDNHVYNLYVDYLRNVSSDFLIDMIKNDYQHMDSDINICIEKNILTLQDISLIIETLTEQYTELKAILIQKINKNNVQQEYWRSFEL